MMTKDQIIAARQELTALGYLEDPGERRPDSLGVMPPVFRVSTLGHIADAYLPETAKIAPRQNVTIGQEAPMLRRPLVQLFERQRVIGPVLAGPEQPIQLLMSGPTWPSKPEGHTAGHNKSALNKSRRTRASQKCYGPHRPAALRLGGRSDQRTSAGGRGFRWAASQWRRRCSGM